MEVEQIKLRLPYSKLKIKAKAKQAIKQTVRCIKVVVDAIEQLNLFKQLKTIIITARKWIQKNQPEPAKCLALTDDEILRERQARDKQAAKFGNKRKPKGLINYYSVPDFAFC